MSSIVQGHKDSELDQVEYILICPGPVVAFPDKNERDTT